MSNFSDNILSFETELSSIASRIAELKELAQNNNIDIKDELKSLHHKYTRKLKQTYKNLTPWQIVEVARHPDRPHVKDYLEGMFDNFFPLGGDRLFGEDNAILGGVAKLNKQSVVVIGIEKGNSLEEKIQHNFGMANPWGYRKAIRLMDLAEKLKLPVVALVDTPGAYPGLEAEQMGQGSAIATSIAKCLELTVPMVSVIIGEGGSGGALAIAAGDISLMLEYSVYSVISPEGCASILWKDDKMAKEAAKALCLTSEDLAASFNIVDKVIKEPLGGAHRDKEFTINSVKGAVAESLKSLGKLSSKVRKDRKHQKFLNIGVVN